METFRTLLVTIYANDDIQTTLNLVQKIRAFMYEICELHKTFDWDRCLRDVAIPTMISAKRNGYLVSDWEIPQVSRAKMISSNSHENIARMANLKRPAAPPPPPSTPKRTKPEASSLTTPSSAGPQPKLTAAELKVKLQDDICYGWQPKGECYWEQRNECYRKHTCSRSKSPDHYEGICKATVTTK
ncbi:hypothetical protein AC578_3648 [Pseudocercospora eumusae]|uniref:Uncharacterized protein n=1 Tax=Pseudocercospora eumusae TaxID=321146 RepID=A0A139GV40_9PEZI|nr:hypothetical protein AC578_3648 [Pseudocercospora eumusae]